MESPGLDERRAALSSLRRLIFSSSVPWARQRARFAAATSATAIADGVERGTFRFGRVHGETLRPRDAYPNRAILYVHGGGYCIGSPVMGRALASWLAATFSATVYGLDYRLAPEHPAPAAIEDVTASLAHLAEREVVGLADSAGAGALVAALALVSPWLDLARDYDGELAARDPLLSADWLGACARAYADGERTGPHVSPLRASWSGLAPTLVVGGEDDLLAADAAALAARGDPRLTVRTWPGLWHDFALALGQVPEATEAAEAIAAHVGAVTGWRPNRPTGW